MEFNVELAWNILPSLLKGAGITLALIPPTMVLGMIISIPITMARLSSNRVLAGAAWSFTTFFRGAPALILLYMVYNGLATLSIVRDTFLWNILRDQCRSRRINAGNGMVLEHFQFGSKLQCIPAPDCQTRSRCRCVENMAVIGFVLLFFGSER